MAALGVRSIAELIGRTELPARSCAGADAAAAQARPVADAVDRRAGRRTGRSSAAMPRNAPFDKGELAERMVARHAARRSRAQSGGEFAYEVKQLQPLDRRAHLRRDRAALGQLRHERRAAHRAPDAARPARASASGMPAACTCYLEGDANDYVGKGMAGGQHRAAAAARCAASSRATPSIMGNTCLYGATGGELYAAGQRRRALRGAQLRRDRRHRGRRRSLLRVHDRRRGLRARPHRA